MRAIAVLALCVAFCSAFCAPGTADAQVHRCMVDGKLQFTDTPCHAAQVRAVGSKSSAADVGAEVQFRVLTRHYTVTGSTIAHARQSLRANGPSGWAGMARWRVQFTHVPRQVQGGCTVSALKLQVEGDILMPEWVDSAKASAADRATWQASYDRLKIHEDGHVQHGREFAVLLRERLMGLGVVPCAELESRMRLERDRLHGNLRTRDADYDRRTDHGLRQDNPR